MNNSEMLDMHKAESFFEILEGLLKSYSPSEYAPFVSALIDKCISNPSLCAKWPPHYLIHSIEANCAYHRKVRNSKININQVTRIINHYNSSIDPLAKKFLSEIEDGFWAFLINMARQQFYLQYTIRKNDLARAHILFGEDGYPRSKNLFQNRFGISFFQWITLGFSIYTHIDVYSFRPAYISQNYFFNAQPQLVPDASIPPFFSLISATPDEIKKNYQKTRNEIGTMHEKYIPGSFIDKPLLKIDNDKYLIVHKGILIQKTLEGIFDLCKSEGVFGQEFGKVFEKYVGRLLSEFIAPEQLFTEKNLRSYSSQQVCDYLVNGNDYILLIECKGTEYSSITASINALQKDNSTKKIAKGINQLNSIAKQIQNGVFFGLLGDVKGKKIISLVVTFKHIYFTNIKWYWDKVICLNIDSNIVYEIENTFSYQPQILSVDELEKLLVYKRSKNKNFYDIFAEKLDDLENKNVDWGTYLKSVDAEISFLNHEYEGLFDKILTNAKERISPVNL